MRTTWPKGLGDRPPGGQHGYDGTPLGADPQNVRGADSRIGGIHQQVLHDLAAPHSTQPQRYCLGGTGPQCSRFLSEYQPLAANIG